ncbi:anion permease [Streptomyces sp. L7]
MAPFKDSEGSPTGAAPGTRRHPAQDSHRRNAALKWIVPVLAGLVVHLLPQPDGIKSGGWAVLAVFTATVLGLILAAAAAGRGRPGSA